MHEHFIKRKENSTEIAKEIVEIAIIRNDEGVEKYLCCDGKSHWVSTDKIIYSESGKIEDTMTSTTGEKTPCDCVDPNNRVSVWSIFK